MSERRLISSGSPFEVQIGYSRAVVQGDFIFVSGCTGYDYTTSHLPNSVLAQTAQCMLNIHSALAQAGATMADIVRVRYILPDRNDFPTIWPILQEYLREVRPAATMIQAGLMEEGMKVEIEVTAMRRAGTRVENEEGEEEQRLVGDL